MRKRRRSAPARRNRPPRSSKVSVTVDSAILRDVKAVARRSRQTLSAHVTQALARDLRRRRLAELIAEYEAEAGVISQRELAEARATWRG
jgi:predicted transcriptional regulator